MARVLDDDKTVLISSLDLGSTFDSVNIDLLLKRLKIIGLPCNVIQLISVWLKKRIYYISLDGINSTGLLGAIQGSVLGPILYANFVAPLFDIEFILGYPDNTFIPRMGDSLSMLITDLEKFLAAIMKWLRKSGLMENRDKTELCIFNKRDCCPIIL
jgi:hypothetical protein